MAASRRTPVWKPAFARAVRRDLYKRMGWAVIVGTLLGLLLVGAMYWSEVTTVLDWSVVALPIVAGLLQWISPVVEQTKRHRIVVLLGSFIFSGAILWQQSEARKAHQAEMSQLATKKDIPTAADFAREYANLQNKPKGTLPPVEPARSFPNVVMHFVNRQEPLLVLENTSGVLARDIKWTVALWNMDLPERDDPLPIPISTFDWLKPHAESGAQNLFGSQLVKPLVKSGDHLLGSAVTICADCPAGHTYVVSVVFGNGGWYAEDKEDSAGSLIVPHNFHKEVRDAFFAQLPALVPEKNRVTIGEYFLKPARPTFR